MAVSRQTSTTVRTATVFALVACLPLIGACRTERVVRVSVPMANLPEAQVGPDVPRLADADESRGGMWEASLPPVDPDRPGSEVEGDRLRWQNPDGTIELISRSPRHLMVHLVRTLQRGEDKLLLEQVLSEQTRQNYIRNGLNPQEAVEFLKANQNDVFELIRAMPMAERTPSVVMHRLGGGAFRLRSSDALLMGLRFTSLDIVVERGSFRLLMIQ